MSKARTTKALTAGAIANLALAGFVAGPASASTHATPAGAVTPSAGQAHPGLVATPAGQGFTVKMSPGARQSGAAARVAERLRAAQRPGFVPRAKPQADAKPYTFTYCSGDTCFGVHRAI